MSADTLNPPPGYDGPLDPHLSMTALSPPGVNRRWKCKDCGQEGIFFDFQQGGCAGAPKENCKHCGYGPVCAHDCPGLLAILEELPVIGQSLLPAGHPLKRRLPFDPPAYEAWAKAQAALLDAIELALDKDDVSRARVLVHGRFAMAKECGIDTVITGRVPGETHLI